VTVSFIASVALRLPSAPVYVDFVLAVLFAILWLVAGVLSIDAGMKALGILAFIIYAARESFFILRPAHKLIMTAVTLYLVILTIKIIIPADSAENVWLRLVHQLDEGSIKLAPDASTSRKTPTIPVVSRTATLESEAEFEKL
jgi:hypothetical protein